MKLRMLFLAAGLLVFYLVIRRWPDPQTRAAPSPLHQTGFARHLLARGAWPSYEAPTGHIHFRSGSHTARTTNSISHAVDSARSVVLGFLQLRDTQPIEVFFVDSREQMQQLVGRPLGGMVQSGERTALLVYNESYTPFLVHELTHLYTHHHWGQPRAGRWLSEGLAALVSGDCQGFSIDAVVKGLHERGQLRTWQELMRDFEKIDELSANPQAASMVGFIHSRGGMAAVRAAWLAESWQPDPGFEAAWLARVKAEPAGALLDVPRLRDHGCVG
jgi:hypothetical protein